MTTVVFFHGHGQNGRLFRSLTKKILKRVKGIDETSYPDAPHPSTTPDGSSWYKFEKLLQRSDWSRENGDRDNYCHDTAEMEYKADAPTKPTLLIGFSEGGRRALHLANRYPKHVIGVVTLCAPWTEQDEEQCGDFKVPIVQMFTTNDPYVSINPVKGGEVIIYDDLTPERAHKVIIRADLLGKIRTLLK